MYGRPSRERLIVASEKAEFMADRIATGIAVTEEEMRNLARYLRESAVQLDQPRKKGRTNPMWFRNQP
jgi:hypothetical protein